MEVFSSLNDPGNSVLPTPPGSCGSLWDKGRFQLLQAQLWGNHGFSTPGEHLADILPSPGSSFPAPRALYPAPSLPSPPTPAFQGFSLWLGSGSGMRGRNAVLSKEPGRGTAGTSQQCPSVCGAWLLPHLELDPIPASPDTFHRHGSLWHSRGWEHPTNQRQAALGMSAAAFRGNSFSFGASGQRGGARAAPRGCRGPSHPSEGDTKALESSRFSREMTPDSSVSRGLVALKEMPLEKGEKPRN